MPDLHLYSTHADEHLDYRGAFAFVASEPPTAAQTALAARHGIALVPIGDLDPSTITPGDIAARGTFEGVVVTHPVAAMRLAPALIVGAFGPGARPGPAGAQDDAGSLHLFNLVD